MKTTRLLFASIFICILPLMNAQHSLMHPEIKIDTSYTIHSAFKKLIKGYPSISIASYEPIKKIKEHLNLVYQSYCGRLMHLDLLEPDDSIKNPCPCVVLVHGGGWNSGNKSLLEPYAKALADAGYVAVILEYRFSDEAKYPASVIDIKTALKWIVVNASKYNIDTNKISIMGSSAGGQLASLVGVTFEQNQFTDRTFYPNIHPKVNAIINIDGIIAFIHPLSEEGKSLGKPGAAEKWFGVNYKIDSTKWIEASPLTYVGKNTPPTLFIASSFTRFNAGREDMIEIMNRFDIYNEKHVLENAPHTFWLFNPWFKPTLSYIIEFLGKINSK